VQKTCLPYGKHALLGDKFPVGSWQPDVCILLSPSTATIQQCAASRKCAGKERDLGRAHFMKQNGASFCRLSFAIPTKISARTQAERAQNASIKSLERVFGAIWPLANTLYGQELAPFAAQITLTIRQKTSSASGFCHFVPTGAQTKRSAEGRRRGTQADHLLNRSDSAPESRPAWLRSW
jgi:hypothetical protein